MSSSHLMILVTVFAIFVRESLSKGITNTVHQSKISPTHLI